MQQLKYEDKIAFAYSERTVGMFSFPLKRYCIVVFNIRKWISNIRKTVFLISEIHFLLQIHLLILEIHFLILGNDFLILENGLKFHFGTPYVTGWDQKPPFCSFTLTPDIHMFAAFTLYDQKFPSCASIFILDTCTKWFC